MSASDGPITQAPVATDAAHVALAPVLDEATRTEDVRAWLAALDQDGVDADARATEHLVPLLVAAVHAGDRDARVLRGAAAQSRSVARLARSGNADAGSPRGGEVATAAGASALVVVETDAAAERLAEAVGWYVGDAAAAPLVARGVPYGGGLAPAPARVGARAHARTVALRGGVVVASIGALAELAVPAELRPQPIRVAVGDVLDRDDLVRQLVSSGYARMDQAEERGQVAVRGDIVDVFCTTARHPVRIELFDDEVETIREFSAYTQRSLGRMEAVDVPPATEIDAALVDLTAFWAEHEGGDPVVEAVHDAGAELEPVWNDLAPSRILVVDSGNVRGEVDDLLRELGASHAMGEAYAEEADLLALLDGAAALDPLRTGQPHEFEAQPPVFGALGLREAEGELQGLVGRGLKVVVTFPHRGHAERTIDKIRKVPVELLEPGSGRGLDRTTGAWFAVSTAATGFVSRQLGLAVVPSGRLFRQKIERDASTAVGAALAAFTSLRTGDYIVHEDHGVGRFAGFETKTVAGVTRDYLNVEFAGADRLYVPHEQMGKVSRYVGSDGGAPALSKLGGKKWANLKNRARTAVRELAGELLALYARRAKAVGHAFEQDDELMTKFELAFPYQETRDQQTAIDAVKEDMERPQPMDRLICGDVGFGKTEVAMRACVKAVTGGRQVMVLCPTTILANQHLQSFRERMHGLPIEVDMVSRFRSPKDVKATLERFRTGSVDILIGTHRLLSKDVLPKHLGLVVVDEEQRFGVAQKELLRQLRTEVDVLSLSATPIPRTLHMSLAGMRDITIIETAPHGRRPIHTHVGEYEEELVKGAIERELERDGQVYYLHNRVETIDEVAAKIAQVCPKARVGVGHGQMGEKALEGVMLGFLRGDFDVLVATTIIESGLDIPTANTLIVDRADVLGLSQLYQIRGRVGRSARSAHAYLFYPSARELSEEARARLTTLSDFTDLGSGSRIAMRDLELRGAGNLLGADQSGHVAAVGFELYVEMLAQTVAEMSGQPEAFNERGMQIDVRIDAYVPADYVDSEALKIDIHRRIAMARSPEQLSDVVAELEDRFGEAPDAVRNLVSLSELRLAMGRVQTDRLSITKDKVSLAPIDLATDEATELRSVEPLSVYSSSRQELQVRVPDGTPGVERAKILLGHVADVLGR